jgi:hypothetical protein
VQVATICQRITRLYPRTDCSTRREARRARRMDCNTSRRLCTHMHTKDSIRCCDTNSSSKTAHVSRVDENSSIGTVPLMRLLSRLRVLAIMTRDTSIRLASPRRTFEDIPAPTYKRYVLKLDAGGNTPDRRLPPARKLLLTARAALVTPHQHANRAAHEYRTAASEELEPPAG